MVSAEEKMLLATEKMVLAEKRCRQQSKRRSYQAKEGFSTFLSASKRENLFTLKEKER
jgi:hypothetical protein